jgi:HK97 gp10 family phage protein
MIAIEQDKQNFKIYEHLDHITDQFKEGIHEAYIEISKYLKDTVKKSFRDEKSGRIYSIRVNGRIIPHQASAPGEAPAILTGKLDRSIETKTSGYTDLRFSAGGGDVNYAGYLEEGTSKMEPRPYMRPAVDKNEGVTVNSFYRNIGKRLKFA